MFLLSEFSFFSLLKIFLKKNGEFAGTCASQNPDLYKNGEPCSYCGKSQDEKCENEV